MMHTLSQARTCLILSMRHLGDAVIVAGLVNAIREQYSSTAVDVLGREELRDVTNAFCSVREYIPIDIPLFGHHRKNAPACLNALYKLYLARRQHYDCCINLMGDVRENLIGRIVCAGEILAPRWPYGHRFRKHIRQVDVPRALDGCIDIDESTVGYYAAMDLFAQQLGLGRLCWPERHYTRRQPHSRPIVGIHPGASHPSKQWLLEKWKTLILRLTEKGYEVEIFGSPPEAATLSKEYLVEIERFGLKVISRDFRGFLGALRELDVLVGMDSFSVHAAHALGVPAVVLHGPFHPTVMTPPAGIPVSAGCRCGFFPCYKGKSCANTAETYICVQGIEVDTVTQSVEAIIARQGAPENGLVGLS
jgi:heptosyltransferase III